MEHTGNADTEGDTGSGAAQSVHADGLDARKLQQDQKKSTRVIDMSSLLNAKEETCKI